MSDEAKQAEYEVGCQETIIDALTGINRATTRVPAMYELRLKEPYLSRPGWIAKLTLWVPARGGEVHEEMIPLGNATKRRKFAESCVKAVDGTLPLTEEEIEQWILEKWQGLQEQEQLRQQLPSKPPRDRLTSEQRQAAIQRLQDPKLLYRLGQLFPALGLVGETINALLLYLAMTSRLMQKIISVAVKAESSSGKSFLVDTVLKLFPSEAYVFFSGMSKQALVYSDDEYRHRMVVIAEASGIEEAEYNLRTLISENQLVFKTVEKNPVTGRMESRTVTQEGPTGLILTTTKSRMHLENETRYLSIGLDESEEQTRRILEATAHQKMEANSAPELEAWMNAQLLLDQVTVRIPYAEYLAQQMPVRPIRVRRDFAKLLSLIEASAVLHQFQRGRGENGEIEANLADYYIARELFEQVFFQSLYGLHQNTKQLMEAIKQLHAELKQKPSSIVNLETGQPACLSDLFFY